MLGLLSSPRRVKSSLKRAKLGLGKWCLWVFTLSFILLSVETARADSRTERPLQVQLEFYGVSIGYHFSELIYVGAIRQFGVAGNRFYGGHMLGGSGHGRDGNNGHMGHDGYGDSGLYGQDGVTGDDFDYGDRTSIEVRISPEPFGVYLALGALIMNPDKEQVVWDERSRRVGRGSYVTGLSADIEGKPATVPAVGAGINHVFPGGLSIGAGLLYGIQEPEKPKVKVSATNSDVSDADLERFRKKVRGEFNDFPLMAHLAIGYNF